MYFSPDRWEREVSPVFARLDTRVSDLLNAPIWTHAGSSHEINRDRWLQHGKDAAALAALYYLRYPAELPKGVPFEDVLFGFMIHDIGKPEVSGDAGIWHRRRADLTSEELSALQNHVATARDLLKRYEEVSGESLPAVTKEIIEQHHEKLDGSGNPWHLTGAEIAPASRLAVVVDQIISRCEPRAYHDRNYTLNEAFADVAKDAGRMYDGRVIGNLRHVFADNDHLLVPTLAWLGAWQ